MDKNFIWILLVRRCCNMNFLLEKMSTYSMHLTVPVSLPWFRKVICPGYHWLSYITATKSSNSQSAISVITCSVSLWSSPLYVSFSLRFPSSSTMTKSYVLSTCSTSNSILLMLLLSLFVLFGGMGDLFILSRKEWADLGWWYPNFYIKNVPRMFSHCSGNIFLPVFSRSRNIW